MPQQRPQNRRRNSLKLWFLLAPLLTPLASISTSADDDAPSPVTLSEVTLETVSEQVSLSGVVQRNLAIGAVLAIGGLFLFLRSTPATLIGAIGIPICTVAAFLGLLIAGRTIAGASPALYLLNLGGAHLDKIGLYPIQQPFDMITTVAGLSPLVFNPGAGTELYRGLGAIVLFGLLFSTLVTLTFMPALLSLVLGVVQKRRSQRNRDQPL